jgi:hypothetical protein
MGSVKFEMYLLSAIQHCIVFSLYLNLIIVVVVAGAYSEQLLLVRCDIRPASNERSRDEQIL